jgi:hypothetical protein
VGVLQYKRFGTPMRLLVWYVIAMSAIEWFERGLGMLHIQNLWLFHFSTPLELMLTLGVFFYWSNERWFRQLIVFFAITYVVFSAIATATFEPLSISNDLAANISSAIQIFCGIALLISVLQDEKSVLKNDPRFWVAAGTVFYAAGTLFLFGFFTTLLTISDQLFKSIWPINWGLSTIANGFYLRSILCKTPKIQDQQPQTENESKKPTVVGITNK